MGSAWDSGLLGFFEGLPVWGLGVLGCFGGALGVYGVRVYNIGSGVGLGVEG